MTSHILLVDDEPAQLKLSRHFLEDAGYAVEVATSADAALRSARSRRPSLIVSDVVMDEVDGFGLCRRLRDDARLVRVPIVLVSSHYGALDAGVARAVGATTLVERTPDFSAELAAVAACLRAPQRPRRASLDSHRHQVRANVNQVLRLSTRMRAVDARCRVVFEHAADAMAIVTAAGEVIDANRRWTELFGNALDADDPVAVLARRGDARDTIALRAADGATVHVEVTASAIAEDGVLVVGRDVSAAVEAAAKLAATEAMYRSLVERMPEVVWRCDATGRMLFVGPNAEKLFGVPADQHRAGGTAQWLTRVHPEDAARVGRAVAAALASGIAYEIEYRYCHPDGRTRWLHTRTAVTGTGDARIVEGLTADITARRQLELGLAQAQKLEVVGQLASGIAHDFNNVLAVILANACFLLDDLPSDAPGRADVEEIRHATDRAVALTSQLLAFSQRSHVEAKPVDIDAVVRGLERMLRRLIGEDIELVVRVGAELATVAGDAGQIEQLVVNFAVNARDAMPAGGRLDIATDVVTVAADDPRGIAAGSYVRVAVSDTGAGMDEATRRRAFEPFFTTKEPGRGTGLGLWTCYGIVRAMAGDIALASAPGTGTTVTVLLPTTEEVATAPGGVAVRGGDETILLVEDDPAVRGVTARILRDRGYTVLVAARGSDALAIALEHAAAIDAIVSDVVMPGASGPDVVASLRGVVPDARVLLMSGHVDHPSLRGIADAADTTFLAKPFSPARLAAAVRDLLDRGPTYNPAVKS